MSLLRHFRVNYAMVLVMKRGIPCALILKGKTCTHPDPVHIRVSNGTGQRNFSGQRDRNFFLVPGQRDNGTSSKFCHGTGRDGILTVCPVPSRYVPRDRNERKNIDKMEFFSMISCFRTSFPVLERPLLL